VPSLGGASLRYRPIVPIRAFGPLGSRLIDGCVDCGSDDTIFPLSVARKLAIDLQGAPQGQAHPIDGTVVAYHYATIMLRLSDGLESFEWSATVGFVDLPMRWALLGHAGFLDFFDAKLRGQQREISLIPNSAFPGVIQPASPP
jgi:hypothetical protein